jgi:hypothetical protein
MNVSRFNVSCIQETDYRAHFTRGGLLEFLEHCKHIDQCVNAVRLLQIASVHSRRTNKLCTHAHRRDRSVPAAIFANKNYFVDSPRTLLSFLPGIE